MKANDERAKRENELHEADMAMRRVALANMEAQKKAAELKAQRNADHEAAERADREAREHMVKLAEATKLREKEAQYLAAQKEIKEREEAEDVRRQEKEESEDLGRGKRVRKLHWKLQRLKIQKHNPAEQPHSL